MDHQRGEDVVRDAAAKVENTVSDLGAKAEKTIQDKIDQGKPVLRDLQESAAAAIDKTADLARKVSTAGVQAVDAIRSRRRKPGESGRHHCLSAGRSCRGICQPICHGTAADGSAHCRCDRVRDRLPDSSPLTIYALLARGLRRPQRAHS